MTCGKGRPDRESNRRPAYLDLWICYILKINLIFLPVHLPAGKKQCHLIAVHLKLTQKQQMYR